MLIYFTCLLTLIGNLWNQTRISVRERDAAGQLFSSLCGEHWVWCARWDDEVWLQEDVREHAL